MLNSIRKLEKRVLKEENSLYKRYLFKSIDFTAPVVGIVGRRGVGKSTLLIQYTNLLKKIYEPYKSLYFSYEYASNIDIKLIDLAKELSKIGVEYLIVDAIDRYKNFQKELKVISELLPQIKIVFSASSSLFRDDFMKIYTLKGLSYREFLELKLDIGLPSFTLAEILSDSVYIVNKLEDKFTPLEYFNEYLIKGFYPFYFHQQNNYLKEINNIVNSAIDIDVVSLGLVKVNFIDKLKKLLVLIAQSSPSSINITDIASKLEVSRTSVYTYLKHLEQVGMINTVLHSKTKTRKFTKPERIYLNNTNLPYCLAVEEKMEIVRETFFVSQLKDDYALHINSEGDFLLNEENIFEVGIKNKELKQIHTQDKRYLAIDTDKTENIYKIPLWLFGFLY